MTGMRRVSGWDLMVRHAEKPDLPGIITSSKARVYRFIPDDAKRLLAVASAGDVVAFRVQQAG